jgi:hypothetical protein
MDYGRSGVILSPDDERDYLVSTIAPRVALPSSVRLDHKVKRIRNQLFCGTCVGKAAAGLLSAEYGVDLSSLFIWGKCKQQDGIPDQEGTFPRIALKVMQKEGSCPDYMLPYSALKVCLQPPAITEEMEQAASPYKISTYARAWNVNDIKRALANDKLLLGTLLVGDNFMRYGRGVLYAPTTPTHEYHLTVFCGYDDELQAVRGFNSWGEEDWGERGFFWISYDTLEERSWAPETWAVTIEGGDNMTEDYVKPTNKWLERKFWLAIATAVLIILNDGLGFGLDEETILNIIKTILGWILIEGGVDATKILKNRY